MEAGRPHIQVRITGPAITVQSHLHVVRYHVRVMFGPSVRCCIQVMPARHPGEIRAYVYVRRKGGP